MLPLSSEHQTNYSMLEREIDKINYHLRHASSKDGIKTSLNELKSLINDNRSHFYHKDLKNKKIAHLTPDSPLTAKLMNLKETVSNIFPESSEKTDFLLDIEEVLTSANNQLSQEELLLNQIEPFLPEEFPRFNRDEEGKIIDPKKQLNDLRTLILEGLALQPDQNILAYQRHKPDMEFDADDYIKASRQAMNGFFGHFFAPIFKVYPLSVQGLTVGSSEFVAKAKNFISKPAFPLELQFNTTSVIPNEVTQFNSVRISNAVDQIFLNSLLQKIPRLTYLSIEEDQEKGEGLIPSVDGVRALSLKKFEHLSETVIHLKHLESLYINESPKLTALPGSLLSLPIKKIACAEAQLPLLALYLLEHPTLTTISWKDRQDVLKEWSATNGPPLKEFLAQYLPKLQKEL